MATGPDRRTDAAVRLGSGRQLGFAEWGDPQGAPVLFFHATPGSRRRAISSHPVTRELGVRLICLERPGFGLSQYQPGRSILNWPDDVAEFADILGLDNFAVLGLAGGSPYALACGYRVPERLTGVGIVAGLTPPELYRNDELISLVRRDPSRAREVIQTHLTTMARDIDAAVAALSDRPGTDGEIYGRSDVRAGLIETGREALRGGLDGVATDVWLQSNPWRFSLAGIARPVHWWHGQTDGLTPLNTVREAVAQIPRATLTVLDGGHAVDIVHGDEILATVAGWA